MREQSNSRNVKETNHEPNVKLLVGGKDEVGENFIVRIACQ